MNQRPEPDFRRIFDETPAPLLLLTPDLVIVHANRARLEATATTLEATVGRGLFEVFPMNPDDPAADGLVNLRDSLAEARDTRRPVTMAIQKYDIPLPDGTWVERFWSPRNVPVLDERGEVVWLLHRADDITDYVRTRELARASAEQNELLRQRADRVEADLFARTRELEHLVVDLGRATARAEETAVRAEEATRAQRAAAARTAEITESMAVGYLAMDADWCVTYVNAQAVQALGRPREALVGGVVWALFPGTVGTDVEAGYRRAATTGEAVTFDAYYPEPLNAWYEVRAVPEAGGVALYFIDITARQAAQAAVERSSARVSALGRVALAFADADSVADLAATSAEQASALLGADGGGVAVADPADPEQLAVHITASFGEAVRADYGRLPRQVALPIAVAALEERVVLLGDRAASEAFSAELVAGNAATGCQAWAALPLRSAGQVLGALALGWSAPQAFTGEQVELLETIAAQCAQALARLAARDAERAATAQQQALVAVARALAGAETEAQVLAVANTEGLTLLSSVGAGLCLREDEAGAALDAQVRILATDTFDADLRASVQRVPADFPMPLVDTAVTGQYHFFGDRPATVAAFPGAAPLYEAAGVQASASVPLRVGEHLLGSMSLAFTGARAWSAQERELVAAFAVLTAQALQRITARTAERRALEAAAGIAETLQRAMLTAPPQPDHLQVAVRYAAAGAHAEVGGDWYDAFVTADGATSVAVGDVTGHDMAAAAVMGQMRNMLRAVAYTLGASPAAVLSATERAAAGLGVTTLSTVVLAQLEQDEAHGVAGTRLLRWSNAGHLPPLLVGADGSTCYLDRDPDPLLGLVAGVVRHDHEVVLQAGATVLLFTDGLVERRGASLQEGLDWLAGAVGELAGAPLEDMCDGLLALVGTHLEDDVALLALRAHSQDRPCPVEAGPSRTTPRP